MTTFHTSYDIYDYKPILEGLVDVFGFDYYHAILAWCDIIENNKEAYWKIWLIKNQAKIVGICGLYSQYPDNNDELWLGWFGVLPAYRNMGIGKCALDFMKTKALSAGAEKLMSYVDKNGEPLGFYEKYGFIQSGSVAEYLIKHPKSNRDNFGDLDDFIIEMPLNHI